MSNSPQQSTDIRPGGYAVVFTSRLKQPAEGYEEMAQRMVDRVFAQPGFISAVSFRDADGHGVTISYWRDEESIRTWRMALKDLTQGPFSASLGSSCRMARLAEA